MIDQYLHYYLFSLIELVVIFFLITIHAFEIGFVKVKLSIAYLHYLKEFYSKV